MYIDIDEVKINYKLTGKGKNLVLLHGWGCNIGTFDPVHKYMENKFRTLTFDFPGFGDSDFPESPWTIEEYSDFTVKLFEALNIKNPIIIGHSFGGRVGIILASKIAISKLILVDSAGIKPKRSLKYYLKVYSYKTMKKLLKLPILNKYSENIIEKYRRRNGSEDYKNLNSIMQATFIKVVNRDLKDYLPKIMVPTLLIWGENDTATPLSDGRIMEKYIPDSGLVVFKGAGHYSYLEKLKDFNIIVSNFLKDEMEDSSV